MIHNTVLAPLPNLNDVSAIHSTTMTTHIDETMFSTRSDRRSSTDSLASFAVKERRSSDKIRHSNSDLDLQCDALLNCKVGPTECIYFLLVLYHSIISHKGR